MSNTTTIIQAAHYGETEQALARHPLVLSMWLSIPETVCDDIARGETVVDMQTVNREFARLEELNPLQRWTKPMHLGAVKAALKIQCERQLAVRPFTDALIAWEDGEDVDVDALPEEHRARFARFTEMIPR